MQANDFEKRIRDKMEGFELVPNDEVWKQVSAKISTGEDERRTVFLWIFIVIMLSAGAGGWWFIHSARDKGTVKTDKAENNNIAAPGVTSGEQSVTETGDNEGVKQAAKAKTRSPGIQDESEITKAQSGQGSAKTSNGKYKKPAGKTKAPVTDSPVDVPALSGKVPVNDRPAAPQTKKYKSTSLPPHRFLRTGEGEIVDIDIKAPADSKKRVDTSATTKKEPIVKSDKGRNWKFGFSAYTGVSDINSGLPLVTNQAADYLSSPIQQSTGGFNSGNIPPLTYKTGFSFALGVSITKQLTQKTALSIGLNYRVLSARSTVGNRVNGAARFYDSVLQQPTSINSFYQTNGSGSFVNTWHLLELPVNLQINIKKSTAKPLLLVAGISPGYLISSNALYVNQQQNMLYKEDDQFRSFQLSAQTGILFTLKTSKKFQVNAGPVFHYGFTNLTRSIFHTNQHLISAGIKAGFTLK